MAKKVLVVTDVGSGDEAIYIEGKKVFEDSTVYATDIAEHANGQEVVIEHRSVHLVDVDDLFPDDSKDLLFTADL
jgi:hypothetical protein